MIFRLEILICSLLVATQVSGQELEDENLSGFMNLLEFLGEFEDLENEEGEWIDPSVLVDDVFANLDESETSEANTIIDDSKKQENGISKND